MRDMVPVLICLVIFATIGWVVYVIADAYRRRQRLKVVADIHTRVLDRMGSATEFGTFLQTDGGKQFLESLTMERTHPAEKVARAMQTGIVLTAVGIGLIMVRPVVDLEAEGGFTVLSALILSLGVGFLLSAVASWMLGRTFGLFTKSVPMDPKIPTFTDSSPGSR
jgi:hypothetical protein